MARLSRVVIPGVPHHVTQRGNRRERTFFEDGDYQLYLDLLAEAAAAAGVEVWAYCLMPNHVHLIVTPSDEEGLSRTFRREYGDRSMCPARRPNQARRRMRRRVRIRRETLLLSPNSAEYLAPSG